jgi:hypothetical protein
MFLLFRGTPPCSYSYKAPPNQVGQDEPFSSFFFHKFFFLQLWWCCRAIVVTARLFLRSLLMFNTSVLFFVGVPFMFFHKFHFIWCDVVDDPTWKKRKTFLGLFGQFQFCHPLHWPNCREQRSPAPTTTSHRPPFSPFSHHMLEPPHQHTYKIATCALCGTSLKYAHDIILRFTVKADQDLVPWTFFMLWWKLRLLQHNYIVYIL